MYYTLCNTLERGYLMAADYPDWVMAHKKKGTYINKVGDRYYLYAAHSERIKGTDKVRRVSDGYLGRITKEDGLIPANKKLRKDPEVFEIGLSYTILSSSALVRQGLRRSFPKYGDAVYSCSVLSYIYGEYSPELFEHSYLRIAFPDISLPDRFTKAQLTGIERGIRMLEEHLKKRFGDDAARIRFLFPDVRLLKINDRYYLSKIPGTVALLSEKYDIDWRNSLWQK